MIISFIDVSNEAEDLVLIDDLSINKPVYVMTSGTYSSTGTYHEGDDLEAEYCARQETYQHPELIFTEKEEVEDYIKNDLYLSHINQLNGEFDYEVVEFYEVENGSWKLYKRFISE